MAACGEGHCDRVADLHIADGLPDLLHVAGSLVSEDEGEGARDVAVLDREVGVAESDRGDPDEDFVRADVTQGEVPEGEGWSTPSSTAARTGVVMVLLLSRSVLIF